MFLCDNWCGIRIVTKEGQRKQEAELENGSSQLEEYKKIFLRFQRSKIQNVMNAHRPAEFQFQNGKRAAQHAHMMVFFNKVLTFSIISASCSFLRAQRCYQIKA